MKSTLRVSIWILTALLLPYSAQAALILKTGGVAVSDAVATAVGNSAVVKGLVVDDRVQFESVLPGEKYDLTLHTNAGQEWRLIDMSWHADVPLDPNIKPTPLSEDDRKALQEILSQIKTFTNRNTFLQVAGNSERAVALVELYRDSDFHARKGDEIVWRIEVWYFENQAGGWAKVPQQNRVIERSRFGSREAFEKHRNPLKWLGINDGTQIERGKDRVIDLLALQKAASQAKP